ncbi:MAG TPA: Ig-like domain-containing protein [Methanoregulaceae archaeon]|nr:Ig-like domain-containing protein [Methanoregulaceae archaeon]
MKQSAAPTLQDIYSQPAGEKNSHSSVEKFLNLKVLTVSDKSLINGFIADIKTEEDVSSIRANKLRTQRVTIKRILRESHPDCLQYADCTWPEIRSIVEAIKDEPQLDYGVNLGSQVRCDATGTAKYTCSTFAVGQHSFTASYLGDSNFTTSTSPPISPTVTPDPVIVAFTPLSGSRGTTVMIMIKGNYIQAGATANLTLNGNRLPITTSAIKPPIMLSGSVTIPTTVTPGQWILSVTDPDGGTVQRIFTVT